MLLLVAVATAAAVGVQPAAPRRSLLREYFGGLLDANNDGVFTAAELASFLTAVYDTALPVRAEQDLDKILHPMDLDGSGGIDWEEFRLAYADRLENARLVDETSPEQVHIAATETPSEMWITWTTFAETADSTIQLGQAPGQYSTSVPARVFTYDAGEFGWDGFLHEGLLTNLEAWTWYYYRVGSPAANSWSPEFRFRTIGTNFTEYLPLRYAVFGDMGTFMPFGRNVSEAISNAHAKNPYDMTMILGDIAYAGTGSTREFEIVWDIFFRQIEDYAATAPFMTTVGNHEKYYDYTAYRSRFHMPAGGHPGGDEYDGFFYSFDFGPIHWTVFASDSYPPDYRGDQRNPGSEQWLWIQQDLQKASQNRQNVPFIVVTAHRPMYGTSGSGAWEDQRVGIEPLLDEYDVDLFLAGHVHVYERTLPISNFTYEANHVGNVYKNPESPIHVTIGTAGALIVDQWEEQPEWCPFRARSYGYAHVIAVNSSALHFQFFANAAVRDGVPDGLLDEFWIMKD